MSKTGVTVYCWGVDPLINRSGTLHFFSSELFGGNLGHAAILLTIPNTPENFQFVKDKLGNEYTPDADSLQVPWVQKSYVTPSITLNQENARPNYDKLAFQENVIEIYFSWCNAGNEKGFEFQTFEQDVIDGRCDVAFDYADNWKMYLQPEERSQSSGILSFLNKNKSILLGSAQVIHAVSTTPEEQAYLTAYQKQTAILHDITSIELLLDKIQNRINENITKPLTGTEKRLFAKYLPEIDLKEPLDFNFIQTKIAEKKSQLLSEKDKAYFDVLDAALILMQAQEMKKNSVDSADKNALLRLNRFLSKLKALYELRSLIETAIEAVKHNTLTPDLLRTIKEKSVAFSNINSRLSILECYKPEQLETVTGFETLLKEIPVELSHLHSKMLRIINSPTNKIEATLRQHTMPLIERAVSMGLYPPAVVTLALRKEASENQSSPGMDFMAMVEKMSELIKTANEFNIIENNCSVTSTKVLIAGAQDDQHREEIFKQGELANTVANLSTVFNNAVEYKSSLTKPNYKPPIISYYQLVQQYVAQTASDQMAKSYQDEMSKNQSRMHFCFSLMALATYGALATPGYLWELSRQVLINLSSEIDNDQNLEVNMTNMKLG